MVHVFLYSALHDLSKDRFYTEIYIKSHMRAMTYLIGILAGYVYMKLKEADYKLSLVYRINSCNITNSYCAIPKRIQI